MRFHCFLLFCSLFLISSSFLIHAQQSYIGIAYTNCSITDNSTSIFGYTCNGLNSTCQGYLIFRSQPPYNTVSSISRLLASNPSQLSDVNAVPLNSTFETNKEVIVPVNCSCSGNYYQANTSHVIEGDDNFFVVANDTYQGLSTCHALQSQNNLLATNFSSGTVITVPLRCACPTKNQTDQGLNYLLSYIITWGDTVRSISGKFGVDTESTLEVNEKSFEDSTIYPFTTLLIPLENPPNSQTIAPSPPPPPVSPSPPSSPSSGKKNTWIYIVVGVVAAAAVLASIFVYCVFFRKHKSKTDPSKSKIDPVLDSESFESRKKSPGSLYEESQGFFNNISDIAQSLKVYEFEQLRHATENFSPESWVKGSVYRGTINGSTAAIKKTNKDVGKEINLLNKINHFHIINLSGVCFNEGYWYLVFEFAENGSLTDWIFSSKDTNKVLSWSERIQIASDVASGLNYLHSYTNPPHVHKDIKTSNVLLDSDFRAKIANLSLARSADGEGEFALTRRIVGTQGYMAPEYLENGYVSPKLDVYSFGIVLLEILTGKETAVERNAGNLALPDALAAILADEDPKSKLIDFIDPSLQGEYPSDLALLLARLIESCLRSDPAGRPAMDEVEQNLSNISIWEVNTSVYENQSMGTTPDGNVDKREN